LLLCLAGQRVHILFGEAAVAAAIPAAASKKEKVAYTFGGAEMFWV